MSYREMGSEMLRIQQQSKRQCPRACWGTALAPASLVVTPWALSPLSTSVHPPPAAVPAESPFLHRPTNWGCQEMTPMAGGSAVALPLVSMGGY